MKMNCFGLLTIVSTLNAVSGILQMHFMHVMLSNNLKQFVIENYKYKYLKLEALNI